MVAWARTGLGKQGLTPILLDWPLNRNRNKQGDSFSPTLSQTKKRNKEGGGEVNVN